MVLNQQTLHGILEAITSVSGNHIVPKQGNWWNPQEALSKPSTYLAYIIRRDNIRTLPFYLEKEIDNVPANSIVAEKIAEIDLQFVGDQAEELAKSVSFWTHRMDVAEQFKKVCGVLLPFGLDALSSNFYQNGNNNILAWNVTIHVLWYHVMDINQDSMPNIELNGKVKKTI